MSSTLVFLSGRFDKHCLPSLLPGSLSTLSQLSDRHHRRYFRSMQKAGQTPLSQPSPDLKESAHKPYVIAPQQVTAIPRSVSLCCHRPGWGVWSAQCTPAIVPWAGRCCHVGSKYRSGLLGSQRSQACTSATSFSVASGRDAPHSARNAEAGSMVAALRAGTQMATPCRCQEQKC